jgi:hypothetical protein
MRRHARRHVRRPELKLSEDPFLLDDPGDSPLEWLARSLPFLREAVRRGGEEDPWTRTREEPETDALTERRRRKLQSLSLSLEDDVDESIA